MSDAATPKLYSAPLQSPAPRGVVIGLAFACGVGLAATVLGFLVDPGRAVFGYFVAWTFATTTAVGGLILLMIGHASKARWMLVTRRLVEPLVAPLPLLLLLGTPLAASLPRLYVWAGPTGGLPLDVAQSIAHKRIYFAAPFFLGRSIAYFAVFTVIGVLLRQWSRENDVRPRLGRVLAMRKLSGAGLPFVALALTWASFDWVMSLQPEWTSTIFGLYFFAGGFISAISVVCVLQLVPPNPPRAAKEERGSAGEVRSARPTPDHGQAMGRVLFAMVIFWAYMAFSQLLLQWIADLPDEVVFYQVRTHGSWSAVAYTLVVGHFFLPFFLLLGRRAKRNLESLALIGGFMILMHYVDVSWMILPVHDTSGVRFHWADLAALLFIGGVSSLAYVWQYFGAPPLPLHAPGLDDGLDYEAAV